MDPWLGPSTLQFIVDGFGRSWPNLNGCWKTMEAIEPGSSSGYLSTRSASLSTLPF
jgi:hypothetical protein